MLGQQLGVVLEFLDEAADFAGLNFDYKRLRPDHVLGSYQKVTMKAIKNVVLKEIRGVNFH